MRRALLGRKVKNLEELKKITEVALRNGQEGEPFTITRTIILTDKDFKSFADDFSKEQPWIMSRDGGLGEDGEARCLKAVNKDTKEKVLINPEGYKYPRYTGLELEWEKDSEI